jgi:hypothetical protein
MCETWILADRGSPLSGITATAAEKAPEGQEKLVFAVRQAAFQVQQRLSTGVRDNLADLSTDPILFT